MKALVLSVILSIFVLRASGTNTNSSTYIKFDNPIGKYITRISKDEIVYTNYTKYESETKNTFLNYLVAFSYEKEQICPFYEKFNQYLRLEKNDSALKCIISSYNIDVQVVETLKEIGQVLAPSGNTTKRNEPGNCILALFYTKNCYASAYAAPRFSILSKLFPYLKFIAVDALKFYSLNTDFGILGLPTIMLFHQGRPVFKFNGTESTLAMFVDFIVACTYFRPFVKDEYYDVPEEDSLAEVMKLYNLEKEFDYYLVMAWSFIIICAIYYFTQSKMFIDLIQLVKRTWHESEIQHQHIQ